MCIRDRYNPVVLTEFSGHAVWVNTAALKFAGITRDSSAEAGGVIVKDEKGEPTGLLFEGPAFRMRSLVPAANRALIENATIAAMQELLKRGVTSATDPGLPVSGLEIYRNIVNQNRLMVRINGMLKAGFSTEELQVALGNWQHLKLSLIHI